MIQKRDKFLGILEELFSNWMISLTSKPISKLKIKWQILSDFKIFFSHQLQCNYKYKNKNLIMSVGELCH